MTPEPPPNPTQHAYDQVAHLYAQRIYPELYFKPFDREQLDRLAARVGAREGALGPICDLGCGPGQVARYLKDQGAAVLGVDLSPGMVAQARALNPDVEFQAGDMRALTDVPAGAWGGIAAFYSLIHIARAGLPGALIELRRVLAPGGWLLAAVHLGEGTLHRDELWGVPVALDFLSLRGGRAARLPRTGRLYRRGQSGARPLRARRGIPEPPLLPLRADAGVAALPLAG